MPSIEDIAIKERLQNLKSTNANLELKNDSNDHDNNILPLPPQLPHPTPPPSPLDPNLFPDLTQNTPEITKPKTEIEQLEEMGLLKKKW